MKTRAWSSRLELGEHAGLGERLEEGHVAGLGVEHGAHPGDEPLPRIGGRAGGRDLRLELVKARVEDRAKQHLLAREAAVERRGPDVGAARDLLHRHLETLLGERLVRGADDAVVVSLRVGAQRLLSRGCGHLVTDATKAE